MEGRDLEDLSSEKFIRKISDSSASLLHPLFVHHGTLQRQSHNIDRLSSGLITVVLFGRIDETIQLPVVHLDEFTHFQIEDLFQFEIFMIFTCSV